MYSSPFKIGFVTCTEYPDFLPEEISVVECLRNTHSICVDSVIWDDNNMDWGTYNLLIIRSLWDYHLRLDEFYLWLNKLSNEYPSIIIENNPSILKWNSNKKYLQDLCDMGLNCVQTYWITKDSNKELKEDYYIDQVHEFLTKNKINECVIKPSISANATNTFIYKYSNEEDKNEDKLDLTVIEKGVISSKVILNTLLHNIIETSAIMVQRVVTEIYEQGEISLMFFDCKYSHSVKKIPKNGEFRVQEDFGGDFGGYAPSEEIIKEGKVFVDTLKDKIFPNVSNILYARIDGIIVNNHFQLMELEVLEPSLFISELSQQCYIDAILKRVTV